MVDRCQRQFVQDDQLAFAELSGDFNPIHVDPQMARRLTFGRCVVHGIHALIWALDCWLSHRREPVCIRTITVDFQSAICVGDVVQYHEDGVSDGGDLRITIGIGSKQAAKIAFTVDASPGGSACPVPPPPKQGWPPPADHAEDTLSSTSGRLELVLDHDRLALVYGHVEAFLPGWQIAVLLATSRLVGVECPGLHSIYTHLSLDFQEAPRELSDLGYAVDLYDERFRFLRISVTAAGTTGVVETLVRHKPVEQPSMAELRQLAIPGEFVGRRALVVGGSRGLGEVTAKLLAAGGAEVWITYHLGAEDAHRIVAEVRTSGAVAECCPFNAEEIDPAWRRQLGSWHPTDLYYFPTPPIRPTDGREFSRPVFEKYCRFYVFCFLDCFYAMPLDGLRGVFYPSSIYVTEKPKKFSEYAAAKSVGEVVCASLAKMHQDIKIYVARLPRLATDQTSIHEDSAAPVLLEQLRIYHGQQDSK